MSNTTSARRRLACRLTVALAVALIVLAAALLYAPLAASARAAGGTAKVIPADNIGNWQLAPFAGNPTNSSFIQGPKGEGAAGGMMAFDSQGNTYVACGTFIERISPDGTARVIAGTPGLAGNTDGPPWQASFAGAGDLALADDDTLYVTDGVNFTLRMLKRGGDGQWITTTLAGAAGQTGHVDGRGGEVRYGPPFDSIAVADDGTVYTFDGDWLRSYRDGVVKTLNAGTGRDDGPLPDARFSRIMGAGHCMSFDNQGNLYVADRWNMAVRKVDFSARIPEVTTYAGKMPGAPGGGPFDGPILQARFHPGGGPCTAFYDRKYDFLLVMSADEGRARVIKDGWIKTFSWAEGGPRGIDRDGNVYIGDRSGCTRVAKRVGGGLNR